MSVMAAEVCNLSQIVTFWDGERKSDVFNRCWKHWRGHYPVRITCSSQFIAELGTDILIATAMVKLSAKALLVTTAMEHSALAEAELPTLALQE
jgi:hypothetical protein